MAGSRGVVLLWILGLTIKAVTSWSLSTHLEHQSTLVHENVTITCNTDVTLTLKACQFMVYYSNNTYPAIDLSEGHATPPITVLDIYEERLYYARYHGSGLEHGVCGMSMTLFREGTFVAGCRGRTDTGGWKKAFMTLYSQSGGDYRMSREPPVVVVQPGGDATVLCVADRPLKRCEFSLPNQADRVLFNEDPITASYRYHGTGLEHGQCGITLENLQEQDAGPVWCNTWSRDASGSSAMATMVTVAKAPPYPILVLATGTNYTAGDTLAAMCVVKPSSPIANVTWFMGYDVIRQDGDDDVAAPDWRWPWEPQSITQTLTVKLAAGDDTKEIRCSVEHRAMSGNKQSKRKIFVKPLR